METKLNNVQPLSQEQYNKTSFRTCQAHLSYPEKVNQVVSIVQKRLVPIYKKRNIVIVPWTLEE